MNEKDNQSSVCQEKRAQMDVHLDGQLNETDHLEFMRHLSGCDACTKELQARSGLRQVVRNAVRCTAVPAGLRERIGGATYGSRVSRPRSWYGWAARVAAAILVVTVLGAGGWQWKRAQDQEQWISRLSSHLAQVFQAGLGDHLHCATLRELKHPLVQTLIEKTLVEPLGAEYQEVREIIDQQRPAGLEVWMAHRCEYHGREFVHVALRGEGRLLSVLLTQKEEGESFVGNGLRAEDSAAHPAIYKSTVDRYQLAGFESSGHLVFIVSNLSEAENLETATALGPSLDRFLKREAL